MLQRSSLKNAKVKLLENLALYGMLGNFSLLVLVSYPYPSTSRHIAQLGWQNAWMPDHCFVYKITVYNDNLVITLHCNGTNRVVIKALDCIVYIRMYMHCICRELIHLEV